MLSARTLACFLASQDDPEKGLCPHELVISPEARGSRGDLKKSIHTMTKPTLEKDDHSAHDHHGRMHTVAGPEEALNSSEKSPGPQVNTQPRHDLEDRHTKPVIHSKSYKDKDPKSFTQNLFDTTPFKLLQAHIPDHYLGWRPWAKRTEPPSVDSNDHRAARKDASPCKKLGIVNSNTPQGSDAIRSKSIIAEAVQPVMSTVKYPTTTQWSASANQREKRGKRTSMSGVTEKQWPLRNDCDAVTSPWKRSKPIADTEAGKSPISYRGHRPSFTRDGPYQSESDKELENATTAPRLKDRKRAVSWTGLESSNRLQEHSPSVGLRNVRHSYEHATSAQRTAHPHSILSGSEQLAHELWKPAETLSHFTPENIDALVRMIKAAEPPLCDGHLRLRLLGRTDTSYMRQTALVRGSSTEDQRTLAFGVQTLSYVLGNTASLLKSFLCRATREIDTNVMETRCTINAEELLYQFRNLMEIDHHPRTVLPSLWIATGVLFNAPLAHSHPRSSDLRAGMALLNARQNHSAADESGDRRNETSLDDTDAAHIVKIVLAALGATIPKSEPETWLAVQKLRASGHVAPEVLAKTWDFPIVRSLLETMDAFEDEAALALMTRLVRAISARRCMSEMAKNKRCTGIHHTAPDNANHDMINSILGFFTLNEATSTEATEASAKTTEFSPSRQGGVNDQYHRIPKDAQTVRCSFPAVTVEWLRSVLLKEWNGKAEVAKWGAVGGAIEMMSCFCKGLYFLWLCMNVKLIKDADEHYAELGLPPETFHTPFLSERLDPMDMPLEWLNSQPNTNTVHLLSYSFLFTPSALVTYFRAINHSAMFKAFEASITTTRMVMQMTFAESGLTDHRENRLLERLTVALTNYLVLEIRRDDVLTCTLNQLWRRERRELMRPLKVRLGMEEGEEGVDHGGIQQEFFRMAIGEALNTDYGKFEFEHTFQHGESIGKASDHVTCAGLFTTDTRTRMTWFQPCSLEPLYKFELLGLLTSLAIYNGLTLPITFPLALYRKLLGMPVTDLEHIRDGWPELAKGLTDLLTWTDGNVEDVFMRSYVFSAEAPGSTLFVDMERIGRNDIWPPIKADKGKGKGKSTSFDADGGTPRPSSARDESHGSPQPSSEGSDGWINLACPALSVDDLHDPEDASTSPEAARILRPRTNSVTSQASMVTNENREQYVMDYIFWLTEKSIRHQYEAFARGFFVCLDKKALSIFTPNALQSVVEGIQEIDVNALEQTARYENGYHADHRIIKDFWHVVRQFSPEKVRQLLEFVTASDRIPVNGIRSILFVIQRNGTSDDVSLIFSFLDYVRPLIFNQRVPTSLTCFGRLLLPEYSSRKKLKEKLRLAIENSKGFGVA